MVARISFSDVCLLLGIYGFSDVYLLLGIYSEY